MKHGVMSGDGRSKVFWKQEGEKIGVVDKICGKGVVDVKYTLTGFYIESDYCYECKKMIISTDISN